MVSPSGGENNVIGVARQRRDRVFATDVGGSAAATLATGEFGTHIHIGNRRVRGGVCHPSGDLTAYEQFYIDRGMGRFACFDRHIVNCLIQVVAGERCEVDRIRGAA